MMRSLFSGVSGLRNHQTRMDVIGNNIANVNTTGFKASRTVFQDIFSQAVRGSSQGSEFMGGTNPIQIGLGMRLGTIDTLFRPGAFGGTDNITDCTIGGDGFFTISTNGLDGADGKYLFTRAGNFYIDNFGHLVTSNGDYVMGYLIDFSNYYMDDANNNLVRDPTFDIDSNLVAPDAVTLIGDPAASADLSKIYLRNNGTAPYIENGLLQESTHPDGPIASDAKDPALDEVFTDIKIDKDGVVWGFAGDELLYPIAKIALAMFVNNGGLEKQGDSLYRNTGNSGDPMYAYAKKLGSGAGLIMPGGLEMSNVDLAQEFTDMIVTQRGFQANSRIITVSDTLLEELVNLKR
ncbi:MAG: flagellar hook-basal body complex protein [Oscillospiraceae bacterium]|nr:flagellar hook-basal body complex protein [Oscillospiraceae bacterium]